MKIVHTVAQMAAIGVFLVIVSTATAKYSGGTGEPNDPYQIATAADLIALGEMPDDYGKHFILTADIDLDPNLPGGKVFDKAVIAPCRGAGWGDFVGVPFAGILDGNGYSISHLTIRGGSYLGLFGQLGSSGIVAGEVRNLGLVDLNIGGSGDNIGGLVGYNWGNIAASHSIGKVDGTGEWSRCTGGLVGCNEGNITDCYATSTVSGAGNVGGLVGYNGDNITDCYTTSTVSGDGSVGGLVGQNMRGSIVRSFSDGAVSGQGGVGGLVGLNYSRAAGGPFMPPTVVAECYSASAVYGNDAVGGLVGWNEGSEAVRCYSTGLVSGTDSVGGLGGVNWEGIITECYSTGAVTGEGSVGGLVGSSTDPYGNEGVTSRSFWDVETSGQATSDGGTGKTSAEMQDPNGFLAAGWDFLGQPDGPHDIWTIPEAGGYPILWWQLPSEFGLPTFSGGVGEPQDPYLISTAEDLNRIGQNPRLMQRCFKLINNINLTGLHFYPIGGPDRPYAGVFNGNSHAVSNLTINGENYLGLFGLLASGAAIRDLGVLDVNIAGSSFIGGLAGGNGSYLLLTLGSSVTNCYSTGSVSGTGICVGGLVGFNGWLGTITTSSTTALVGGAGDGVGGLAGINDGSITMSHATALVRGAGDGVGGLAGWNWGGITASYSNGSVSGSQEVGGLVGYNGGSVVQSYSSGSVDGKGDVGGLVGRCWDGAAAACFWDIETSGQATSAGGVGKTTAEMQTAATFLEAGWDFVDETTNGTEDIWWIDEGKDYPRLWWEPRPVVRLPVIELDATTFDAGIAEGVVLVDFFATWCSPCKTQAPILEEVADRLEGKAQVAKLDIDKARSILQRYGVTAVPTLILFQNGVEVKRFVGVTNADVLLAAILEAADSQ
ncbi:MAG TPA: thioredoxin [Sedimentisphaerales bacterium]|nr:thioredoxin [Sedimentisphaerales bacterium]HNU28649.1 thioredoxin [Sedimentisphaerales bacterium]